MDLELNYIYAIVSIFQSIFFVYMISYCFEYRKILSSIKMILCIILLSCVCYFIPYILSESSVCIFFIHIISIFIISYFFKDKYIEVLVSYNLIYTIGAIWMLVFGYLLYDFLKYFLPNGNIEILRILSNVFFQFILYAICIKYPNKIKQINKIMKAENFTRVCVIIMSFVPDFEIFLLSQFSYNASKIYQNANILLLFSFIVIGMIYFIRIKERANKIFRMNETLENKNRELRKIKNDYGVQMSSLYTLCLREKYEDVSILLKSIINTPYSENEGAKSMIKESLLSLATKHVISDGVKIVIEDNAELELIAMSELELYRIVVNIVNNAIKAMKNNGTLIAKSYNNYDNITIEIENDGEKIPEKYIDKIFDAGFTTKGNMDKNHGYGLCIAKELIESYNGNIFVESNEKRTKFTIILPMKL